MRSRRSPLAPLLTLWLALVALFGALSASPAYAAADVVVADAPAPGGSPAPATPPRAAEPPPADDGADYEDWSTKFQVFASSRAVETASKVVGAILLFIAGWIVAKTVAYAAFQLLGRTNYDNIIAEKMGLTGLLRDRKGGEGQDGSVVERFVARVVFWIVMLLVIVGVLQFAGLTQVAGPIEEVVASVGHALPLLGKALAIMFGAWVAGRVLELAVTGTLDRVGVDRRFAQLTDTSDKAGEQPFSQTAGTVVFWLMIFLGLAGAFQALEIGPIADPMRNAVDQIVSLLPRVGIAAVILAAGYAIGRIARAIVRKLLQSIGFDKLIAKLQLDKLTGSASPSDVIALVIYIFVLFQASVASLNQLGLETLSVPLTNMMTKFWGLVPALAVSAFIVFLGVVVGQLLRKLVAAALKNVGFDRLMARLGFDKLPDRPDNLDEYSEILGLAAQFAVILLAAAQALDNLQLDTWSVYLNQFLAYMFKNVAVALVVVGVGFGIGNYVRDVIKSRRGEDADVGRWLGEFARYFVLVFAFTMAVRQLEVAEDFVLISFGLLFGALCLAAALAFGLGGREVAGDIVKRRYEAARAKLDKPGAPRLPPPGV